MPVVADYVQNFLDQLKGVVYVVTSEGQPKWKAYCPVHEASGEHDPSLGITLGSEGKILVHCLACDASQVEIVHAANWTMAKMFDPRKKIEKGKKGRPRGKRIAEYLYRNESGLVVYRCERFEPKDFKQSQPNGKGGWDYHLRGVTRVLYRLPELIAAPKGSNVFVVEGEKKVEALMAWGLIATCNVGGAGKWQKVYSKYLECQNVIILPDNDPTNPETGKRTGYEHAKTIIESSKDVVKSIRILELPGLPPKGDIVDWIADGGTLPKLMELVAQPWDESKNETEKKSTANDSLALQPMDPLDLRLPEALSDLANGRRLVRQHGKDIRWCQPWKKWIVWNGKQWKVDDTLEIERKANAVSDWLWDEMRRIGKDISENSFTKVCHYVKRSSDRTPIVKMVDSAKSLDECKILPEELDTDPWLLNVQNGTVDLRNGEFKSHCQSDMITKLAPVNFDPDATCPNWENFILSVFGGEEMAAYIQRLCGYWITGIVREQSLPILWGVGSNGKTTFLNSIMDILGGGYSMKAPSDFLMDKKDRHPTEKADLFGKRFVVCSETSDGKRLDEALVKELTGNEPIRARRMYEDLWEFLPSHKLALVTNHLPQIRGTDQGIWRRIRKIEFGKQFWNPDVGEIGPEELMQDKTLGDKLKQERSGILTWMIKGCIQWNLDGEKAPASVTDWTKEYRASQDVIGSFLEECIEVADGRTVTARDLFKTYKKWAEDNGEYVITQTRLGILMNEKGYVKQHGYCGKIYLGIGLVDPMG